MNFVMNMNLGNWLAQLNDKTVDKIYQVDFTNDRNDDDHLPWIFFILFKDFDKFVEIEGDFDGDHIKINLNPNSELDRKIKENDLKHEPDLWSVYVVDKTETLGQLIEKTIKKIEYGIDKDYFEINGTKIQGQKELFTFIRFYFDGSCLTIFEGGCGLYASPDDKIKLLFEETFDVYATR